MTRSVNGPRAARGLLAALLLAGPVLAGLLALGAAPAHACTCPMLDRAEQGETADLVVAGSVREVVKDPAGGITSLSLAIEVDRVYAGRLEGRIIEVTTDASSGSCGLGALPVGARYFVYAYEAGDGRLAANSCGGTGTSTAGLTASVETTLGPGRSVADVLPEPDAGTAAPTEVERTLVAADADGPDPVLLAAPGGALVVVGLLGLLVLAPLGSRRS